MGSLELRIVESSEQVRVGRFGKLFVVRWVAEPTKAVLVELRRLVDAAVRAEGEIAYCGITDDDTPTPAGDLRNDMVRSSVDLIRQVSEFHLVLSGSSASARLTRSFFRAMVVGVRSTGQLVGVELGHHASKVEIHETVEAFATKHAGRQGLSGPSIVRHLAQGGFVDVSGKARAQ